VLEIDVTLERMIWQVVSRFAELRGGGVAMPPSRCYAMFDGLFQQALLRHLAGVGSAESDLREGALQLLEFAVTPDMPNPAQ
jgi:hypothetical protein